MKVSCLVGDSSVGDLIERVVMSLRLILAFNLNRFLVFSLDTFYLALFSPWLMPPGLLPELCLMTKWLMCSVRLSVGVFIRSSTSFKQLKTDVMKFLFSVDHYEALINKLSSLFISNNLGGNHLLQKTFVICCFLN